MPTVSLDLADKSYDIIVENGILDNSGPLIRKAGIHGKIALLTNETVSGFYGKTVLDSLQREGYDVTLLTVPDSESSKSLAQVESLCDQLALVGIDRKGALVALGGGVIGDLGGFVAAIHYRGIPFIQIPTTIVAQVDSSVGGKTAVNLPAGKNLVGAFHHPRLVIADPSTLQTLPDRILAEGLAEVVKHAVIRDDGMLNILETIAPGLRQGISSEVREILPELIARNVAIKARIVEADEKETLGIRALLNFGHTIGHGIEAAVPYGDILHGEAVSLGIRAALALSVKYAGLDESAARRVLALMKQLGLPLQLPSSVDPEVALKKLAMDKKFESGKIRFVLSDKLGNAFVSPDITPGDMRTALYDLLSPWEE